MRKFIYKDIDERTTSLFERTTNLSDGKPCYKYSYEKRLLERVNVTLMNNFNKIAKWIADNCKNLNGEFECAHNPYHWIKLVVENGKAYLEEGSHGYGYSMAVSTTETATISRGSSQSTPYAYDGVQFFRNDRLEEFLKQWASIKEKILEENSEQQKVFSEDFEA